MTEINTYPVLKSKVTNSTYSLHNCKFYSDGIYCLAGYTFDEDYPTQSILEIVSYDDYEIIQVEIARYDMSFERHLELREEYLGIEQHIHRNAHLYLTKEEICWSPRTDLNHLDEDERLRILAEDRDISRRRLDKINEVVGKAKHEFLTTHKLEIFI